LSYEDGSKIAVPLYDDGDPEHADIKAMDGIWSNRVAFEREGIARVGLLAVGEYMGAEFFLEKSLGDLFIHAPGRVLVELPRGKTWSPPGKSVSLTVKMLNESPFKETVSLEQKQRIGSFTGILITLEPGESRTVKLDFNLQGDLRPHVYKVPLIFKAENSLTSVEPSQLEFTVEVVTPAQALLRRFYRLIISALVFFSVILVLGLFVFAAGLILYRLLVFPRKRVQGVLLYWKAEAGGEGEDLPQRIKLNKKNKGAVVLSFNPDNKKADFIINGSEFVYDIIIKTVWENRYPLFVQGWKALLHRHLPVKTIVQCTAPGIIEFEGGIYTKKELFHSDEFESGGFCFKYINLYGKWFQDDTSKSEGVDVLEGRV